MAGRIRIQTLLTGLLLAALLAALLLAEALGMASTVPAADPWGDYLVALDDAVSAGDAAGARWALGRAWAVALESRRWEGMVAVGDAALRVAGAFPAAAGEVDRALHAYVAALFRAREAGDVQGVLQATEALSAIGEHAAASEGRRLAESMSPPAATVVPASVQAVSERGLRSGAQRGEP